MEPAQIQNRPTRYPAFISQSWNRRSMHEVFVSVSGLSNGNCWLTVYPTISFQEFPSYLSSWEKLPPCSCGHWLCSFNVALTYCSHTETIAMWNLQTRDFREVAWCYLLLSVYINWLTLKPTLSLHSMATESSCCCHVLYTSCDYSLVIQFQSNVVLQYADYSLWCAMIK